MTCHGSLLCSQGSAVLRFLVRNCCLVVLVSCLTAWSHDAGAADSTAKPNVVLIIADDLRADVMSVYGGPVRTSHLEQLAARGLGFHDPIGEQREAIAGLDFQGMLFVNRVGRKSQRK